MSSLGHSSREFSQVEKIGKCKRDDQHDLEKIAEAHRTQSNASTLPFNSLPHEVLFVANICAVQLVVQSSLGLGIALIPFIRNTFGSSTAEQAWYTAAYSLTIGTFILPAGRLGDIYGHKKLFILGTIWLALWQLLAGFAVYSDQIFFDICRAFQGLGGALMFPNATAVLGKVYSPGRRKSLIIGLFGACAPNGFLFGSVFGGMLAEFVWWPWAFWVSSITSCLVALMSFWVVPQAAGTVRDDMLESKSDSPFVKRLQQTDAYGAIAGVSGLVLVNFSLNQGPIASWSTPYTYTLLIVGLLLMAAFFWIELSITLNPLLPLRKLRFTSAFALACLGTGWSSFGIWVYYEWQLFQNIRMQSVLLSAAYTVPTGVSGAIASLFVGLTMGRIPVGYIMMVSMLAFLIGNVLLATVPPQQIYWSQIFVAQLITPWGMDLSFPSAIIILSNAVPKRFQGTAASLATTVQNYSIALGLGFAGTIESKVNKQGTEILRGYRGSWYFAVGLDVIGVGVALAFILLAERRERGRCSDDESD